MADFFSEYHLPTTFDDALALLTRYKGSARVVAGGTDLLLDLQDEYIQGHRPHYAALIDVTRIAGAKDIREEDGFVVIGCGVTHTQIVESALVQNHATALAEACGVVGGPQVRNVATLIGNVAHALPAADGTIALMALRAEVQVKTKSKAESSEWQPLSALFTGPGKSAVDATRELIAAVRFAPTRAKQASAFTRVMRPQGVALPILGMAVRVQVDRKKPPVKSRNEDVIEDVTVAAGPVAPIPFRAVKTQEFLRGKALSNEIVDQAAAILLREVQPRTSAHRATKEYRVELLPHLLEQTLAKAVERAVE